MFLPPAWLWHAAGTAEYQEAQLRAAQQQQHKDYEDLRFRSPSELAPRAQLGGAAGDNGQAADAADGDDAAAAAAAAAAATATTQQPRKRKKKAGGITADDAAAAAAAEAAAAAADTAAAQRQAAALARKKRKTNTGAGQPTAGADDDGTASVTSPVAVKMEQGVDDAPTSPVVPSNRKRQGAAGEGELELFAQSVAAGAWCCTAWHWLKFCTGQLVSLHCMFVQSPKPCR